MASLTSAMMSDYFHRDEQVEEYLERYNEEFEEEAEIEARYKTVFGLLEEMKFDKRSRAWKKADFYTLFVELDRLVNRQDKVVDPAVAGPCLIEFFHQVDSVRDADEMPEGDISDYFRATLQSTNDRGPRATRGRIIRSLLER